MDRTRELLDLRIKVAEEAYTNWVTTDKTAADKERATSFILRESLRRTTSASGEIVLLERIIGPTNDIKDFPPHELARKKGRPVARLHEIVSNVMPSGFGTGFLIAPNLLLTNHHVFPDIRYVVDCAANFLHEKASSSDILNGITFRLRPDIFFYNYAPLDFAIVYVEEKSMDEAHLLSTLEFLPLIATKGKIMEGRPLSIIQYPLGRWKKYAFENNEVTNIDDTKGIVYYNTDTLPAASGSPGFNEAWEVAALHYTGIPSIVDGKWRTKHGTPWDKNTMSEDDILWIANAGKSVSAVVNFLRKLQLPPPGQKYIDTILQYSGDPLQPAGTESASVIAAPIGKAQDLVITNNAKPITNTDLQNDTMGNIIMNFNGQTTVNINQSFTNAQQLPQAITNGDEKLEAVLMEKGLRFDEDYEGRDLLGYQKDFLGTFIVPAPTAAGRITELYKPFGSKLPLELKYHNYSLVMNKKRRFLMWSAANVNYSADVRDKRDRKEFGNDSKAWRLDPRIPAKYQVQAEEFYDPATLVDKGHMVRRDDNVWALNKDTLGIEYANADTFHWTNCTPQHEKFNRDMFDTKGLWGVLENEIKKQLNDPKNKDKDYNQKACVLSGPVLDNENDPEYNDIQYPLLFWKVFAIDSASEGPLVYGFLLSQEDKVEESGLEKEALPRFNATVRALQASLREIERLSGVKFHDTLHMYDVKADDVQPTEALHDNMGNFKRTRKTNENGVPA